MGLDYGTPPFPRPPMTLIPRGIGIGTPTTAGLWRTHPSLGLGRPPKTLVWTVCFNALSFWALVSYHSAGRGIAPAAPDHGAECPVSVPALPVMERNPSTARVRRPSRRQFALFAAHNPVIGQPAWLSHASTYEHMDFNGSHAPLYFDPETDVLTTFESCLASFRACGAQCAGADTHTDIEGAAQTTPSDAPGARRQCPRAAFRGCTFQNAGLHLASRSTRSSARCRGWLARV